MEKLSQEQQESLRKTSNELCVVGILMELYTVLSNDVSY